MAGRRFRGAFYKKGYGDQADIWIRTASKHFDRAAYPDSDLTASKGVLLRPSGQTGMGTFVPGLYGDAGPAPDNRDHVEVWRFEDGGTLVYGWQARSYSITLPQGA